MLVVQTSGSLRMFPFRGSTALATGQLTKGQLRGPRFRRLFPDVYVAADVSLEHRVLCEAALIYAGGAAAITGLSAARLWGAPVGDDSDAVEVTVPTRQRIRYPSTRLRIVRARLGAGDVTTMASIRLTGPVQTAFDVCKRGMRDEAVITVENFLRRNLTSIESIDAFAERHIATRVGRLFAGAMALAEPRSESPMETRCRLVMIDGGLPPPTVQFDVFDERGHFVARLDLAYEEWKIGIEYEGDHHRQRDAFQQDLARMNRLTSLGWMVIRVGPRDVYRQPGQLVQRIKELIARRANDPSR